MYRHVSAQELAKPTTYFIGVDLAQTNDYTALCVLERSGVPTGAWEQDVGKTIERNLYADSIRNYQKPVRENHFAVRHLERLPIGTPYPVQVARVKELHDRLKAETKKTPHLVVDQTGVGRPVVDMLRSADLEPVAITITGGDTVSRDGHDYRVPKRDLVSVAQVLLQAARLKIARALPEASTLTSELLAFKVSISLKGHDSYGNDVGQWRENPHDDLVLAVALACWYGEEYRPIVNDTPPSISIRGSRYSGRGRP